MLVTTECEQVLTSLKVHEENPAKRHRSEVGKHSSSLWNIFIDKPTTSNYEKGYTAVVMIEMYLKEPIQPRHIDPLEYWKENKLVWNSLAIMAFTIPPSSASSERLFSSAGDIISEERNRLSSEKAEMLLFLKKNLPIFDYKY